jgi:hypothetical protein
MRRPRRSAARGTAKSIVSASSTGGCLMSIIASSRERPQRRLLWVDNLREDKLGRPPLVAGLRYSSIHLRPLQRSSLRALAGEPVLSVLLRRGVLPAPAGVRSLLANPPAPTHGEQRLQTLLQESLSLATTHPNLPKAMRSWLLSGRLLKLYLADVIWDPPKVDSVVGGVRTGQIGRSMRKWRSFILSSTQSRRYDT